MIDIMAIHPSKSHKIHPSKLKKLSHFLRSHFFSNATIKKMDFPVLVFNWEGGADAPGYPERGMDVIGTS
jgi:hypothetical protein